LSDGYDGKLLVYASNSGSRGDRMRTVSMATQQVARLLNLNMEIVKFREKFTQIYVYYKNGNDDPIPIYNDKGEKSDTQKILSALRNMMFVLSFHPKHLALKRVRSELMRFS